MIPQAPHSYAPPIQKKSNTGMIIGIIVGVIALLVVSIGVVAVLAVSGTRKYIANAKTAEARNALGMMARSTVSAWEGSELPVASRTLCPSVRAPIPTTLAAVAGKKYQSTPTEWQADPGFSCLAFEMTMPQYYQYDYASAGNEFTAKANGDLDADGVPAKFELPGKVVDGAVVLSPSISETNPDE